MSRDQDRRPAAAARGRPRAARGRAGVQDGGPARGRAAGGATRAGVQLRRLPRCGRAGTLCLGRSPGPPRAVGFRALLQPLRCDNPAAPREPLRLLEHCRTFSGEAIDQASESWPRNLTPPETLCNSVRAARGRRRIDNRTSSAGRQPGGRGDAAASRCVPRGPRQRPKPAAGGTVVVFSVGGRGLAQRHEASPAPASPSGSPRSRASTSRATTTRRAPSRPGLLRAQRHAGRRRGGASARHPRRGRPVRRRRAPSPSSPPRRSPTRSSRRTRAAPAGWSREFARARAGRRAPRLLRVRARRRAPRRRAPARARARARQAGARHRRARADGGPRRRATRRRARGARRRASWRATASCSRRTWPTVTTYSVGQVRVAGSSRPTAAPSASRRTTAARPSTAAPTSWSRAAASTRCSALDLPAGGPARRRAGARLRRGGDGVLPGAVRLAPQLRRGAGHRRRGAAALRRAGAVLAHRRRERRRDRRARGVPRRPALHGGARLDRRGLRRSRAAAAARRDRVLPRRRRAMSGRSPSTRWSSAMPTRDEAIDIAVDGPAHRRHAGRPGDR